MISKILSASIWGIDAFTVSIEVDTSLGLPGYSLVGLPDTAVRESRERVLSAIRNSGFQNLNRKTTVNMAPADMRKEGSAFDLAIAAGILISSEQIEGPDISKQMIIGELSLDGMVKRCKGILSVVMHAKKIGLQSVILPFVNIREAEKVKGIQLYPVNTLEDCVEVLRGVVSPWDYPEIPPSLTEKKATASFPDFSQVKGQVLLKRALEISASGGHNFIMTGSPGSGKSLCASCLPGILTEMDDEESLETSRIYSTTGYLMNESGIIKSRPFRSPHHTISQIALVGGGRIPKPGEVSLAHNGVLFLDEIPEFRKEALEVLRQPIEDGVVSISRTEMKVTFPSKFILGAAMNPCPCGYYGDPFHDCRCSPREVHRYRSRVSGPLMERFDLHIPVSPLPPEDLRIIKPSEDSATIRERVRLCRYIQKQRFSDWDGIHINAHMQPLHIGLFCSLTEELEVFYNKAATRFKFSARSYAKILKVARTIADMDNQIEIKKHHLAEAMQYRGTLYAGIENLALSP